MKKILFMSMAATALLASCSQDETVDMPQNSAAIQFKTFVNKSTRGLENDITTDKLDAFQVWGLKTTESGTTAEQFVGTTVNKQGENDWSYGTTPIYWDNGQKYSFVAIAPAAENGNWTFDKPSTVGQWGSITFTNGDGTTDLIYDIDGTYALQGVSTDQVCPGPINFTFNHLLSRVKFAFTNSMDDGSVINVTDVKITNAHTKGVATLGETATWALAEDNAQNGELAFGNVQLEEQATSFAANETKATDHLYMIPVAAGTDAYKVTFTVTRTTPAPANETFTYNHTVELPAVTWENGHSYQFTADLSAETIDPENPLCEIKFTASVGNWEDFENTDIPEITEGN